MNLKKLTFISIIFIFFLSSVTHNIYDWFPSKVTALLFPVNESIWEHFKMIFTTTLIWGLTLNFLLKWFKIKYHNIISSIVISALTNIILTILIFTPIYLIIGENITVTLVIYLITTIVSQIIAYYILKKEPMKRLNFISLLLIPIMYIIFLLFTYYPPHISILFRDDITKTYGIPKK